jgi:nucleotide-binding universal stress UspA family protein
MTADSAHDDATRASPMAIPRSLQPFELDGRIVLLATDGSPAAQAAARVARGLAAQHNARVHVVSAGDTRLVPLPPPLGAVLAIADASTGAAIHESQAREVRELIASAIGERCEWPVRMVLDTPARAITREATRLGAALIVLGLRRHGRLDRTIHDETVVNVLKESHCPVLAVSEGVYALPTRALAALDFSDASQRGARTALAVMGTPSSIVLAYVPLLMGYLPEDGEYVIHDLGVKAGFEKLAAELSRPGISVDHVVLHHEMSRNVADILLDYADEMKLDLLAAGSVRHRLVDKWLLGSVSTDLVRDGRRSVLIVPPRNAPATSG